MKEETLNKGLASAIFIVLIIILATPLFLKQPTPAFTITPVLRLDYIDNRTICDIFSISDYYYRDINATMTTMNGSEICREYISVQYDYIISIRTRLTTFNLTVTAIDMDYKHYSYNADINITGLMWHTQYYVFLNITEHRQDWNKRLNTLEKGELPYKTSLDEVKPEGS